MSRSVNLSADDMERLTDSVLYAYGEPTSIVLLVLYALTFLVGFAANVVALLTIYRRSPMDRVANAFMVNLCVCDLLVISLCIPVNARIEVYRSYVYGPVLCRLLPYVQAVSVATSVLTLTAVSLDRYLVICNPLRAMVFSLRSRVKIVIPCIWAASLLIMLPIAIFSKITERTFEDMVQVQVVFCEEIWPAVIWKRTYDVTLCVVLYVIPLSLMALAYTKVGKTLWNRAAELQGTSDDSDARENSSVGANNILLRRRRVVRIFAALTAIFALSWLPYFLLVIWFDFYEETKRESALTAAVVYPFLLCLGLSNSALNAVCYLTLGKNCCVKSYNDHLTKPLRHRNSPRMPASPTREEGFDFEEGHLEMDETLV